MSGHRTIISEIKHLTEGLFMAQIRFVRSLEPTEIRRPGRVSLAKRDSGGR